MRAADMVKALRERGSMARCPAHDDRNPSLSVTETDGKILAHCFAGCPQETVVDELKAHGLWPDREFVRHVATPRRSIARKRTSPVHARQIIAEYDYRRADGELVFQVCRTEPKDFFQRHPDGRGWINKAIADDAKVLYNLRNVRENIFIVEGERDVLTLADWGFVDCCEAGGANERWLPQYTDALRGREVVLIPDRDGPGYARVKRIARELLDKVAKLVYLELEDGKDVTEWFSRGHSETEFIWQLENDEVAQ